MGKVGAFIGGIALTGAAFVLGGPILGGSVFFASMARTALITASGLLLNMALSRKPTLSQGNLRIRENTANTLARMPIVYGRTVFLEACDRRRGTWSRSAVGE